MKMSDIFVENLVNKKLFLVAFYHLTYQHDSKDFNICNYKQNYFIMFSKNLKEKNILKMLFFRSDFLKMHI